MLFALLALPLLLSLAGLWRWAWLPVAVALALPLWAPGWAAPGTGCEVLPGLPLTIAVQTAREQGLMRVLLWVYGAVHIYSLFYLGKQLGRRRYFSLLGLFLLGMATLMAAQSWLALVLGWETIGLASFALVAHYRREEGVSRQAAYVFWVNRLGDMALLAGVGLAVAGHPAAVWCLVGAACVKSALMPFSFWLPWAMVGPTPVSALLHAATLVVSGVVLLTHPLVQPLLVAAPFLCHLLTGWAASTALLSAWMACRAHNLKRLLAYSTVAHVALMMLWPYASGGAASLEHLGTHAFFKTGLFLGLGLVHTYERVPPAPWRQVFAVLGRQPVALAAVCLMGVFGLALVGAGPFASHASKAAVLFAEPGGGFFHLPQMLQGRSLFIVLYTALSCVYAARFVLGYAQVLAYHTPAPGAARGQVLVLTALVPFLFWQPFVAGGELRAMQNVWPSASFLDVTTAAFLLLSVSLEARRLKAVRVLHGAPAGLAFASLAVRAIARLSAAVNRADSRWAALVVWLAELQVVLAWLLHSAERLVLAAFRLMGRLAVEPLRWLVDDQGRLSPGRMAWTAIALALLTGYYIW